MVMFKRYEQYMDSGLAHIGEVPNNWGMKKLKYISNVQLSNVDKKSVEGEVPVRLCNYVDVYYNNTISEYLDFMQATAKGDQIKRFRLRKNDVLITKDSESPNDIAIPAWVERDLEDVLCGYHLAHIRPGNRMNGRYLFYCFDSLRIREQYYALANGVTRFGLSKDDINNALFYVPKVDEQIQIANFLDQKTTEIDNLIADKDKLITLLEEQRQVIITEAVTKGLNPDVKMKDSGVEWIGEIPDHWEKRKLTWIFNVIGSGTTPTSDNTDYYDGETPWLNTGDLNDGYISSTSKSVTKLALNEFTSLRIFPINSLVLAMYGATIGKLGITKIETTTNQACCVMASPVDSDVRFLFYWFLGNRNEIINLSQGGGQPNISQNIIKALRIFCPPFDEQVEIAQILDKKSLEISNVVEVVKIQIDKLKEYRQSLIYEAVSGKIDVRDIAAEVIETA